MSKQTSGAKPSGPTVPVQKCSNQRPGGVSGSAMKAQGRNMARASFQKRGK